MLPLWQQFVGFFCRAAGVEGVVMFRRKGSRARTSPSSTPARGWGDRGVTAVEYALIASLVVLVTFGAVRLLNNAATNSYDSAETQIGDPATICSIDKWYNATEDRCDPKTACDTATQWYDVDTNTCAAFAICASPTAWRNPLTNTCEATADCSTSPGTYLDTASNTCLPIQGASAPNLSAVAGVKRVDLSWTAPTVTGGGAITGYSVQRSLDGTTWTNITYASALPPATTLPVTGLLDGTKYFFQVAAITTVTGAYGSAVATTTGQPVVTAVTPNSGPLGGLTLITITGTGYMTGATVTVGGNAATAVTMVNSTKITARTPPGTSGGKAVTVTNPNTLAGTLPSPAFTYVASPSATTLAPTTVTSSTARLNGTVNANGASTTVTFCYGLSTTLSPCTPVNATPLTVTGSSPTSVLANVSGLTANRNYYFRVSAVNANGTTPGSIMQFTTLPALPTGQAVSSPSKGLLTATWSTIPNDGGSPPAVYRVQIDPMTGTTCSTNGADYGSDQTTTAGSLTFTGLTGSKYCARVRAENSAGTSAWTSGAGPATVLAPTVPGAPTGVVGTPGNTSVSLSWTAPADNGGSVITDYVVQRSANGSSGWTTVTDGVSSATTVTVTGLTNGNTYYFRVAAKNAIGTGANSAVSAVVTPGTTVPGAPTGLTRTSGRGSVALSWTAPADNGGRAITDYVVQYSTSRTGGWTTFADGVSTATTATVTGLTNGTVYYFRVAATNSNGTGPYSTISTGVRPTAVVPGAPTAVSGTARNRSVALTWTAPGDNGGSAITDYMVQYSTSNTGPWTSFVDGVSTATIATVTGLTNGTLYYFRVAAKNAIGTGPYSTVSAGVRPAIAPPGPPTNVDAVMTVDGTIRTSWIAPIDNGGATISGYVVDFERTGVTAGTICTSALSYNDAQATAGALAVFVAEAGLGSSWYCVRVYADNSSTGTPNYAYTGPVFSATPAKPAAPSPFSATRTAAGTLTSSWGTPFDGGSAITGYTLQFESDGITGGSTCTASSGNFTNATDSALAGETSEATTGLGSSWYCVRIFATNAATGTTNYAYAGPAYSGTPVKPDAPDSFDVSRTAVGTLTSTWGTPFDGGSAITGYTLQFESDGITGRSTCTASSGNFTNATDSALAGATSEATTGLNSRWYCVRIFATNAATGTTNYAYAGPAYSGTPVKPDAPGSFNGSKAAALLLRAVWTTPFDGGSALTGYMIDVEDDGITNGTSCGTGQVYDDVSASAAYNLTTVDVAVPTASRVCVRIYATNGVATGTTQYAYRKVDLR